MVTRTKILEKRVRAGKKQSDISDAFDVSPQTFGRNERKNTALYFHAVNGLLWSENPVLFVKDMVKAGKLPIEAVEAMQKLHDSHANIPLQSDK